MSTNDNIENTTDTAVADKPVAKKVTKATKKVATKKTAVKKSAAKKEKRQYTKTMRWLVLGNDTRKETAGLIEALNTTNELLRSGAEETVSISRIRPDA